MKFDDITNKVKQFSRDTAEEVQKRAEIRQLNTQVNAEKKKIISIYTEVGKKLYELQKEEPMPEFEQEFHSLTETFKVIDRLQERIRGVKGVTLCPSCKKEVPVTERFCSNCGAKMPEVFRIEEMYAAENGIAADGVSAETAETPATEAPAAETENAAAPGTAETAPGETAAQEEAPAETETAEAEAAKTPASEETAADTPDTTL